MQYKSKTYVFGPAGKFLTFWYHCSFLHHRSTISELPVDWIRASLWQFWHYSTKALLSTSSRQCNRHLTQKFLTWTFVLSQGSSYKQECNQIRVPWANHETDLVALSLKILWEFINRVASLKFKIQLPGSICIWQNENNLQCCFQ